MPPQTGRQRAARIPLDYYKRPTLLDWGRGWLALGIAALVALGWWATGWLWAGQGQAYYSRGPLTAVHASWDSDCAACHTPFTPVGGEAWAKRFVSDVHTMNQKCEACHAGPLHHPAATPDLACASCHHDHRGRDASLVRLADGDCTQCHGDMKAHMNTGSPTPQDTVTAFASHPAFNSIPNTVHLKFSHARHMALGMNTDKSQPQFTLASIQNAADRERYQPYETGGLIQLQCGACHQLDGGDFGIKRDQLTSVPANAVLPARTAGAAMLPIVYENQCRACHPLSFGGAKDAVLPHRLQPPQVHQWLEDYYTAQFLKGDSKLFEQFVSVRPLPGKLPEEETKKVQDIVQGKVQDSERYVWSKSTCGECHEREHDDQTNADRIAPTNVPDLWYPHAVFDHTAHRAVDCQQCHAPVASEGKDFTEASLTQMGMTLPPVATCQQCHAPRSGSGDAAKGGARFDCTECHRYHNGDNPLAGLGAEPARRSRPGSIEEFLSGSLKAP